MRNFLRFTILSLWFLLLTGVLYPSEECRKELAAYLKEAAPGTGLYWSVEFTGQLGTGSGEAADFFSRDSVFAAIEYNPGGGFSLYFEGGARYYTLDSGSGDGNRQNRGDDNSWGYPDDKIKFRLKEAYTRYSSESFEMTAGLSTMTLGDYFLLDERAFGGLVRFDIGKFSLSGAAGSVVENFTYGDKGWLKNAVLPSLSSEGYRPASSEFGNTNFAGFSLVYYSARSTGGTKANLKHSNGLIMQDAAFTGEEDEFEVFDDGSSFIEKAGIIFNYEFGDEIGIGGLLGVGRTYYGAFAGFDLLGLADLNLSAVIQDIEDQRTLGWYVQASRAFDLKGVGGFAMNAGYMGVSYLDGSLGFAPSFTHMAKGEIFGFEPFHAPLIFFELEYNPPANTGLKLSAGYYARTAEDSDKAQELDFILKIPVYEGLRSYFFYCVVDSDSLTESTDYIGMELRFTI